MTARDLLRQLPAVDHLLALPLAQEQSSLYGRAALVDAIRADLQAARQRLLAEDDIAITDEAILRRVERALAKRFLPTLRPVINATGVIIHTNLGRALLSRAAQQAVLDVASNYSNLEFNLETGKRGSRYVHAEELLRELTGTEAALVVNNNASALVLLLSALAQTREVIISRGQLVEIGGGFRIPDIMQQSGAHLVEVGTTNRTRAADYAAAIGEQTAMLMRIHSSNFRVIGFVQEASLPAMADVARAHGVLLVDDLGSGAMLATETYGLLHEPTVQESVAAGADLILFSGDKLLGGPQAGILVGQREVIERIKKHPLARAFRADKLCYAALGATLDHYRRGDVLDEVPVWQMIAMPLPLIERRATAWAAQLGGQVLPGHSTVGGGSLPGTTLPTALLALAVPSPDALLQRLREAPIPVIARIMEDRVLFDPRTVPPDHDERLILTIQQALAG